MGRLMKLNKNEGVFEKGKKRDLRLVKSIGRTVRRTKKLDAAHFIKDFEEIVSKEMQKAARCIDRINDDVARYSRDLRFQLYTLKELWRLVPPSKNREERAIKIMNKVAFCKQTIQEYEQCAVLIKRRALLLQEELGILLLAHSH
jgi:hypothetical protein